MKNMNSQKNSDLLITYYKSPIGTIEICETGENIISVLFLDSNDKQYSQISPLLEKCVKQLDEYFHYKRQNFDLPLMPQGTSFQKTVWEKLKEIPYGTTSCYFEIARRIGNPKAVRAIGGANGKNPIAIIIPCHRVIGANGKLVGYGGGLWRKEWLLKHEQSILA